MDRRAAIVFAACAAPRLLALTVFPLGAPTYYDTLATGLLTTGRFGFDGVPSTYIEPLYPAFLAATRILTGNSLPLVLILQIVLASFGGVLLYRLGARLVNRDVGFYAALFYACYPYLIRQSVALLEITLCATLAIAATLQLSRMDRLRDAVTGGVLLALLILTRASFAPVAAAAAIWLLWRGRVRLAAGLVVTLLLVLAPWLVRNIRVDGSPVPSRVGENLYLSTSDYATVLPVHDIDLLVPLALLEVEGAVPPAALTPTLASRAIDEAMLARAIAFVRARPGRVLWLKARNVPYLFTPQLLPRYMKSPGAFAVMQSGVVRAFNERHRPWIEDLSHAVAQAAIILLSAIGLGGRGLREPDVPLLLIFATGAAVCIAFFPTTRLMAPVMFVPMFYAAVGLDRIRTGNSLPAEGGSHRES
jgi:4-amino-4-deoxy-L-arabinose transferase-like glycosyltransferase